MLIGAFVLVRWDIAQRREAFSADARVAHRLLSQRAAQHDAILSTLVLLSPALGARDDGRAEQHLSSVQPQVVSVLVTRPDHGHTFAEAALEAAHVRSKRSQRAEAAAFDAAARRFTLVRAGDPSSFALVIDVQRMVPWDEWPIEKDGAVRVALKDTATAQALVIQPGQARDEQPTGLTEGFTFAQPLATASQPFELQLRLAAGPAQWPWRWIAAWAMLSALGLAVLHAWQQGRKARRRAEALLRVGQVARLNAMGELAAGVAHELNQPLTAVMANTQAARRLIDDDPPELRAARDAMVQATAQARRAADVVARLRRLVETPKATPASMRAVWLDAVAHDVLELMEPEAQRRGVTLVVHVEGDAPTVLADPVALEQIVHNLVGNAMQALDRVPTNTNVPRRLELRVAVDQGRGVLTVRDNGPGIAPEVLPRLFEPFFTTREGGLGLGLSLCESLAHAMHATLEARNVEPHGAEFRLALPLAKTNP